MIHVWSVRKYGDSLVSIVLLFLNSQFMCWGERTGCLVISDGVREHLSQVQEDAAPFIEDLDSRFDFEIFANGIVEWVEGWFAFPKEVGNVEDIRSCSLDKWLFVSDAFSP